MHGSAYSNMSVYDIVLSTLLPYESLKRTKFRIR